MTDYKEYQKKINELCISILSKFVSHPHFNECKGEDFDKIKDLVNYMAGGDLVDDLKNFDPRNLRHVGEQRPKQPEPNQFVTEMKDIKQNLNKVTPTETKNYPVVTEDDKVISSEQYKPKIEVSDSIDYRKCFDFKKFFKKLNSDIFNGTTDDKVSDIVLNGLTSNDKFKLFLGGRDPIQLPDNIYKLWEDNNITIIEYSKSGIVNYQYLKYIFIKKYPEYRNKKKIEDDVKNNKDAMAKYIKWIYETYNFSQMKKFIGSTASLFNYDTATSEEPTDSKLKELFSFYLLKDFFKRNNNEYLKKDLYKNVEYKPLTNKQIIPLRLLHGSVKPDIHFDKMIADRYTNSSKSFTPNDLTNLLGMMNFQEKLKNQVGGGQYGGSHLYEHIFENLQNKLAGYKIKINHNDEAEINKYIHDLADNEKKIVDSLDTIKKFTYSKNIGDYKGNEVSVDDMYNEIIKTRKDSADKEDKLMGFITKLNRWIKEHFNE